MTRQILAFSLLFAAWTAAQTVPLAAPHVFFRVSLSASAPHSLNGRILLFVKRGSGDKEVNTEEFRPEDTWVIAREVHDLAPGASVEVDGADIAFPASFATMAEGQYEAQAVLDPGHTYNYEGRAAEDWMSPVVSLTGWKPLTGPEPSLTLDHHPEPDPRRLAAEAAAAAKVKPGIVEEQLFLSPVLTRFWGRPTQIKAWIILPPEYAAHPERRYPAAYWTHGFGGDHASALRSGLAIRQRMDAGSMPPMIWVMLDESCPQGTHEFADSVNDGPWGTALTTEFLPHLEQIYRMDAKPSGRLLNGHSSGGGQRCSFRSTTRRSSGAHGLPHPMLQTFTTSPASTCTRRELTRTTLPTAGRIRLCATTGRCWRPSNSSPVWKLCWDRGAVRSARSIGCFRQGPWLVLPFRSSIARPV